MSVRNLQHLLEPTSVAVVGASDRPASVGATVMRNLLGGGFAGQVWPVNPKHQQVAGRRAYARVADLPLTPDLAVICTPAITVPGLIAELGARGTRAAVVLSAGLSAAPSGAELSLTQRMLDAAQPYLLRILGPNCVGLLVPGLGLNASFAHIGAKPGKIAFLSQSGALVTALLDWAASNGIGFSHFISVGERADVDFADLIDYLGSNAGVSAILMYIESIKTPRKFLSAARAAARNKPLIVVKSGRATEGARAAASHTGALAGDDAVIDAAIRRAGMLRVDSLRDLFVAVETLAHAPRFQGERLMIMTNGGGAGVLAADAAARSGVQLASLTPATALELDRLLPATWSHANPVDIIGDAPASRHVDALNVLANRDDADALLFLHAPVAVVSPDEVAQACLPVIGNARLPILAGWLGDQSVAQARRRFDHAGVPTYSTPEEAVRAFDQLITYRRNQQQLMQAPPSNSLQFTPQRELAHEILRAALAAGHQWLSEAQAKAVLSAYGIDVVLTRTVSDVDEACVGAAALGYPIALKILSPDITHKSDVGGVALDIDGPEHLRSAAQAMLKRVAAARPNAQIDGFTVQAMVHRPDAQELIVGVATDPLFGPVILFGHGGTAVEVIADRAVALPPLNEPLAAALIARTRVARLLAGYRGRPPADMTSIEQVLVRVSQMIIDLSEIAELDINPLIADQHGALALDARIKVQAPIHRPEDRLAIRPYPRELEESLHWRDRRITLRPIRPDDHRRHLGFLKALDPQDIRMRVFIARRSIEPSELARLTQIDYEREMAFIALDDGAVESAQTLGVVRAIADPDNHAAEFGIVVRSDLKGMGLGHILVDKLIRYVRKRGTEQLVGDTLADNRPMLGLAREFGFGVAPSTGDAGVMRMTLNLR